jgi:hypothetical protein
MEKKKPLPKRENFLVYIEAQLMGCTTVVGDLERAVLFLRDEDRQLPEETATLQ